MVRSSSTSTPNPSTAIDLFCGCGGLSCGLRMAGVAVLAGLDINDKYSQSFAANFPDAKLIRDDVTNLEPRQLARMAGVQRGELTLLAGGPPCQGFSKNVPRRQRWLADPRNLLMKRFLDYCEYLEPQNVLIENVAEMRAGFDQTYTNEITDRLDAAGYSVVHSVFNAADFGVPQRRRRAFFLASRSTLPPQLPIQTHFQPSAQGQNELFTRPSHVSVWDAISDLPPLSHGTAIERLYYQSTPHSSFQSIIRSPTGWVENHQARLLQPKQLARLSSLLPGQGHADLPARLRVKGGYSGAYGRLTKEMVCPTITRWVFHPGSGRWGHPVDIRTLTIREISRIQSFPDSYRFVGSYNDMAGQLGNAVPPLLIRTIAETMLKPLPSKPRTSRSLARR